MTLDRVVSGGQAGVDRAALDAALEAGIPCGGWCPRGRRSETGPIDPRYPLTETNSPDPARRTDLNVRDADGTLIISPAPLAGGTALTRRCAERRGRPCLTVEPDDGAAAETVRQWLRAHGIRTLNVAGPRESRHPGIYARALELLREVLSDRA